MSTLCCQDRDKRESKSPVVIRILAKMNPTMLRAMVAVQSFLITPWTRLMPKDPTASRIAYWRHGNLPRVPITDVFAGIERVDVTLLRTFDRKIGTSLDAQEIMILAGVVKFTGAKNILEIGTFDGNTALNLAANSPGDARVTTVDLPPDWDGKFEMPVPWAFQNVTDLKRVGLQYRNTSYAHKIHQVYGDSATIDWTRMPTPFDLVFIDGCHYYEYVKKDTGNAIHNLRPGGVLVWHDYGSFRHVSRVVDETARDFKVNAIWGTRFAIALIS